MILVDNIDIFFCGANISVSLTGIEKNYHIIHALLKIADGREKCLRKRFSLLMTMSLF